MRRVEVSADGGQTWKDAEICGMRSIRKRIRDLAWNGSGTGGNACCSRAAPMSLGRCSLLARNELSRVFQGAAGPLQDPRRPGLRTTRPCPGAFERWERAQCDLMLCFPAFGFVRVRRYMGSIADLAASGRTPTPEEIRAEDITISPDKESSSGAGNGKRGRAPLIFAQKCATCHGQNGSGGLAPMLIKPPTPVKSSIPCLEPCIGAGSVMALHAPYATVIWDYINRGMPFKQEGSLKPDEVYSLTAFLLFRNGVIQEDEVLAQTTLPQVKMPNRDGYAIPNWKPGMPRPFPNGH